MDVETPHRAIREVVTNTTEEAQDLVKEREEQKRAVVSQLTAPCLKSIEEALQDGRYMHVYMCVHVRACMCVRACVCTCACMCISCKN